MKKYILLFTVLFFGCYTDSPEPISNRYKETTVEILHNIDSLQVSIVGSSVYIMKDSLVHTKARFLNEGAEPINFAYFTLLLIFAIFGVVWCLTGIFE